MARIVKLLPLLIALSLHVLAASCASAAKKQYPKLAGPLMAVDEDQDLDQLRIEEVKTGQPGGGCPS